MVNTIRFETTVHDCTIIKLGGSWAITLPKDKLEKNGFTLGMPIQADLSFDLERDTEDIIDYSEDLQKAKDYVTRFDSLTEDELVTLCDTMDLGEFDRSKPLEEERLSILIELKSYIRFMEKEQKELEDSMNENLSEDDFDYDKKGKSTVGVTDE